MALMTKNATAARNAQVDAVTRQLDGGYLRLYSGPRPANADEPIARQQLLAELRFSSPAFEAADRGAAQARTIIQETSAKETGQATWFRTFKADGVTAVFDGSVGTADANIVMNNANIQINAIVSLSAFSYSMPAD